MTRGLSQAKQRFENVHARLADAHAVDALEHAPAIRLEQIIIELPLRALELDVQRLLDARRQVGRHLLLRAPQDHRPQRTGEHVASAGRRRPAPASRASAANADEAPSIPGFKNSNRLQSSSRRFSIGVPVIARRWSARSSRAALADAELARLDRLRFVEDRVVERDLGELRDVAPQRAVRRDHDVDVAPSIVSMLRPVPE